MKTVKMKSESSRSWFERQHILSMEKYISKEQYLGKDMSEIIEEVNENLYRGQFLGIEHSYSKALEIFFKEKVQDSRDIIFWWNETFFHLNLLPGTRAGKRDENDGSILFMIEKISFTQEPLFTYVLLQLEPNLQLDIIDTYERYTAKDIRFKIYSRSKFKIDGTVEGVPCSNTCEAINECLQLKRIPEVTYRFRLSDSKEKMDFKGEGVDYRDLSFVKKYPHLFNDDKLPYKDLLHYIGYLAPACRDAFLLQCAGFFMKEIMDIQYREGFLKNMKISTVHSRTIVARRKLEDILLRERLLGGCD